MDTVFTLNREQGACTLNTEQEAFTLNREQFKDHYFLREALGSGSYGKVHRCRDRHTGAEFACKVFNKARTHSNTTQKAAIQKEIQVLETIRRGGEPHSSETGGGQSSSPPREGGCHPGLINLNDVMESKEEVFLVMDLCKGGDLFELLNAKGRLPEPSAKLLFRQIASALEHCHNLGVIHRDIKPENIILDRPADCLYNRWGSEFKRSGGWASEAAPPVQAKLADFGLAAIVTPGCSTTGYNGSRYYVAPEMIRGGSYNSSVDIWSLGVLLCAMLTGSLPFRGRNHQDREGLRRSIQRGHISFSSPVWHGVSAEAKELVSKMLRLDPQMRPEAWEVLCHPWCAEAGSKAAQVKRGQREDLLLAESPRSRSSPLKDRPWELGRKIPLPAVGSLHALPEEKSQMPGTEDWEAVGSLADAKSPLFLPCASPLQQRVVAQQTDASPDTSSSIIQSCVIAAQEVEALCTPVSGKGAALGETTVPSGTVLSGKPPGKKLSFYVNEGEAHEQQHHHDKAHERKSMGLHKSPEVQGPRPVVQGLRSPHDPVRSELYTHKVAQEKIVLKGLARPEAEGWQAGRAAGSALHEWPKAEQRRRALHEPEQDAHAHGLLGDKVVLRGLVRRDGMCTCNGYVHLRQECGKAHLWPLRAIHA